MGEYKKDCKMNFNRSSKWELRGKRESHDDIENLWDFQDRADRQQDMITKTQKFFLKMQQDLAGSY